MRPDTVYNRFGISALAFVALAGLVGAATAQRSTDAAKLNALSEQLRREYQAKRPAKYYDLLRSTDPAYAALNNNPDMNLMFLRENGMPAYVALDNLIAAQTVQTDDVWPLGVGGGFYGLTGGTTAPGELAIWDGGGALTTHVEFGGRVAIMDGAPVIQHATHVSGTMVAAGVNGSARGMSYQAPLRSYEWTDDFIEMAAAAAGGLQVSNHSYGYVAGWQPSGSWYWWGDPNVSSSEDVGFGQYDATAADVDQVAYDAPYYLICIAATNERDDNIQGGPAHFHLAPDLQTWVASNDFHPADGQSGGFDTIPYMSNAKNILTIGACNDLPSGWTQPSDVIQPAFSSWGPTDDGRIKPDVMANGVGLFSCNNNGAYASLSGTSMATPNTSGSVNLIAQDYETVKGSSPRSSTLKALVVAAADEAGLNDGPDYSNGWGLLNTHHMADIVHAAPGADLGVLEADLANGETDTYVFEITSPQDARVTIAWTDPPSVPAPQVLDYTVPRLINDLDLRVEHVQTATTTMPWRLDVAAPATPATKGDNIVDNVEQVDIDVAPAGTYRVTVGHKGTLGSPQDYAIVFRGMHEAPTPVRPGTTPSFTLSAPYPSPVTGTATIDFNMGQPGRVKIAVYDVSGRRVAMLLDNGSRAAGNGSVTFDAGKLPSGVYFVKMETASQTLSKKITVVK